MIGYNNDYLFVKVITFIIAKTFYVHMSFEKLRLKKDVISALNSLGYKEPREVQEEIIPLAMQGKDIVFTSRTGSGKTLAYTVPFLSKINLKLGIQMVVMVPTRELCMQVGKEMARIAAPLNIKVGSIYGGREISGDQRTTGRKLHIVVGTPGRLIQHINNKSIKVGEVKFIVYDESDQMFDDGFMKDCIYLKERASKRVQILLASATITIKVNEFINRYIPDHEFLMIGDQVPKNIKQEKLFCTIKEKNEHLIARLNKRSFKRVLVFCNTKLRTYQISELLKEKSFKARPLSGDLKQDDRTSTLNLFKQGRVKILVTTDVAARGLDITNIDMIVNYDIPRQDEFYVHRIGRTGRSDKKGYAINFICPEDEARFKRIEELYELEVNEVKE